MTPTPDEAFVAGVIEKLTEAQRAAYPYLSETPASFISIHVSARTRRALVAKGLLIETPPVGLMGFYRWHLSNLGKKVRHQLLRMESGS